MLGSNGQVQYTVQSPPCCGGPCSTLVPDCRTEGCWCYSCRVPDYIYKGDQAVPGQEVGKIVNAWTNCGQACCSTMNDYEVEMPAGAEYVQGFYDQILLLLFSHCVCVCCHDWQC